MFEIVLPAEPNYFPISHIHHCQHHVKIQCSLPNFQLKIKGILRQPSHREMSSAEPTKKLKI